jgi:hypothetical protein
LGVIGLNPAVFWSLSLTEWLHVQRGYFMKEELQTRQSWEQARLISFYAVKPHVKRNTLNTVDSLFKFGWEKQNEVQKLDQNEIDYIIRKYGRFYDFETDKFVN